MATLASGVALAQTTSTRTMSFVRDSASGLLTQEVIEPNEEALRLQGDYGLDPFGNQTSLTLSGPDIATRSASATYDARGQFRTSTSNALGHSESWEYDPRFGLPTKHTDPNGLVTTWAYDGFGRKTQEVRADGTRTAWSYQYCSGVNGGTATCPAGGAYLVQAKALASDGTTQVAPTVTSYRDLLDRLIAGDTQGFDGSTLRASVEYDALGRVKQKSRPYFTADGVTRWTTYTYDVLGRVVTETSPDSSTISHAYHGLATSDTNALGQTRTTVRDSQRQTASVTDAQGNATTFAYGSFGNLTKVTDAVGNVTTHDYDKRGRRIASNDPNLGLWTYGVDTLDQLISQTDAKGQVTTLVYDALGRIRQRSESDLTSTWIYDTATKSIGKLTTANTSSGYTRSHNYDSVGRLSQVEITVDDASYIIGTAYDSAGRMSAVTYPSGFKVTYAYNATGHLSQLSNSATSQVYWSVNAADAELRVTQQIAGNGVVTDEMFDPDTGRVTSIAAGSAAQVQSLAYTYDLLGRLLTRSDANTSLSESFGYDSLNRLTSTTVDLSPAPLTRTFAYDTIGNLISKSDVGTYSYPAPGRPRPHGVTDISGGLANGALTYDANGNMTSGIGLTIGYTSYNKPATVTRGTNSVSFDHDPEHQRFRQIGPGGTTLYFAAGGVMAEKFSGTSGIVQWNNYLVVSGQFVGVHIERSDATTTTRYFHNDRLGSISVITDAAGAVVERLSYDAWGRRRQPNGAEDPSGSITSQTARGFTGHEHLADVGLVHMNARLYDPNIGRVASADIFVSDPADGQAWNSYSYVNNSPTNFIDPSGWQIALPGIVVCSVCGGLGDYYGGAFDYGYAYWGWGGGGPGGIVLGWLGPAPGGITPQTIVSSGTIVAAPPLPSYAMPLPNPVPPIHAASQIPGLKTDGGTTLGLSPAPWAAPSAGTALAAVGRTGLGLLGTAVTGIGAFATGMVAFPSATQNPDDDNPQYVVRGGLSAPATLQRGVGELTPIGLPGRYGISSSTAPRMSVDQIATAANYPNAQITYTTVQELNALGYTVQPTPTHNNPLHASILLPPGQSSLTVQQAATLGALFSANRRPNPTFGGMR